MESYRKGPKILNTISPNRVSPVSSTVRNLAVSYGLGWKGIMQDIDTLMKCALEWCIFESWNNYPHNELSVIKMSNYWLKTRLHRIQDIFNSTRNNYKSDTVEHS